MGGGTSRILLNSDNNKNQKNADQGSKTTLQGTSKAKRLRKRGWSLGLGLLLIDTFDSEQSVHPGELKVTKYSDRNPFAKDFVQLTKIGRCVTQPFLPLQVMFLVFLLFLFFY